jgi:chorismate dehydratase
MPVPESKPFRVASVSYLNAKPLICGLENEPRVRLSLAVPSKLLDSLRDGSADVALLPVIDYQRLPGLTIIPAGGIGSDGATLTVRIFSRVPIEEIRSLGCDTDSHTSVALARIILSKRYNLRPEFGVLPPDGRNASGDRRSAPGTIQSGADEARLLIGDKVVCAEPPGFPYQLDLGAEWKALTGLPFVFATWMARSDLPDPGALYGILEEAKTRGLNAIDQIIESHARPQGWPVDIARRYLTRHLKFHVGQRELEAIGVFHDLAHEQGLIQSVRPLDVFKGTRTRIPATTPPAQQE